MVKDISDCVEVLEHRYNVSFCKTYDLVLFEGGKLIFRDYRKFKFSLAHDDYYIRAVNIIDRYYRLNSLKNNIGAE